MQMGSLPERKWHDMTVLIPLHEKLPSADPFCLKSHDPILSSHIPKVKSDPESVESEIFDYMVAGLIEGLSHHNKRESFHGKGYHIWLKAIDNFLNKKYVVF